MYNNFLEVAESHMEAARVCSNDKILHEVAFAVDAILAHFREERKPIAFDPAIFRTAYELQLSDRSPAMEELVAKYLRPASQKPDFDGKADLERWALENIKCMEDIWIAHLDHQAREELHRRAEKLQTVVNKLGSWASAAQDDPGCCQELKDIFNEVLDLAQPLGPTGTVDCFPGQVGCTGPEGSPGPDGSNRPQENKVQPPTDKSALAILRALNEIYPLGDIAYHIREIEAQGWEGPKVTAWGVQCTKMQNLLNETTFYGHKHDGPVTPEETVLAASCLTSHDPYRIPEPLVKAFEAVTEPWPKDWPAYYHRNEPCDMLVGPCSCGAWHVEGEFSLEKNFEGTRYVERNRP